MQILFQVKLSQGRFLFSHLKLTYNKVLFNYAKTSAIENVIKTICGLRICKMKNYLPSYVKKNWDIHDFQFSHHL